MKDSLAQQSAQTPSPSTGSRQATHNVGNATSSAILAACDHAFRHAENALWRCEEMEREGAASITSGPILTFASFLSGHLSEC